MPKGPKLMAKPHLTAKLRPIALPCRATTVIYTVRRTSRLAGCSSTPACGIPAVLRWFRGLLKMPVETFAVYEAAPRTN